MAGIPKVFHRIWVGKRSMGAAERACGESWMTHHPDWEEVLWHGRGWPKILTNYREFRRASSPAQKADIARYEVVFRYGGVYIDTDFECLKPIDDLLDGVDAFLVPEDSKVFAVGIFGATPRHPLLRAAVKALPQSFEEHRHRQPDMSTGPLFLTRLLKERPELLDGVTVFEPELFYPYPWDRPDLRGGPFPDAYGVHHWAHSWRRRGHPLARALRQPFRIRVR